MKFFNITFLLVVLALTCCLSLTHAQEEAATGASLSTGPKRPALRRPAGKAAKTTTPPPPPKDDEGDYGDENPDAQYGDEAEEDSAASSTTTTTTEPPKKIGPVIRPFRSNDDFLNSLKRRQQDAKKHRSAEKPTPKSRPAAVEDGDEGAESAPAPAPAPAKGFKAGNTALNRRKLSKPGKPESAVEDTAAEESEQEPKEDAKAKRLPHARLALRKRT